MRRNVNNEHGNKTYDHAFLNYFLTYVQDLHEALNPQLQISITNDASTSA